MEKKIIHAHIFNPSKALFKSNRKDKSHCTVYSCSSSETCGLFARGECNLLRFLKSDCPYGSARRETGPTIKAQKFSSWVRERESQYKDYLNKLKNPNEMMAVVGEYVYLPYPFMNMNTGVFFLSHGSLFNSGSSFIKLSDFTVETILNIVNFNPQAFFGGSIGDYQKTVVPNFLIHLSEVFPELYKEITDKSEYVRSLSSKSTHIGREAFLHSLNPNIGEFVDIHKAIWKWDGEWLYSTNSKASFMLVSKFEEVRIKPNKESIVKITHNDQVNSNTIFKN